MVTVVWTIWARVDVARGQGQVQVGQVELEGVHLAVNPVPEVAGLHALGHLAGKLQGLGGDNAHQAEQRDQDNQEQDETGEGRSQDLIAPQQAGEAMVKGLGGEKQHQRHENVEEIRFDDEVGIVEHQQGDDPEKEPGEPGVQAFLDLHDRDGG